MASSTCSYSTFLQRLGHSDAVWLLKPSGQQDQEMVLKVYLPSTQYSQRCTCPVITGESLGWAASVGWG